MKNRKKAWLVCVMAALALTVGFSMAAAGVSGDTQSVFGQTGATVVMDPGAGIRKDMADDTENGIRFLAAVPDAAYERLERLETETDKVSYGMLVADAADVAEHGALRAETVFGEAAVYEPVTDMTAGDAPGDKVRIRHFAYDTLPTGEDYSHAYNERMIVGELTDFAAEDLTRELVGIAYIAYSTSDGTEYLFAEDNGNSVSMTYVAQVAIEKGLDDDNGSFAALYVDKVPEANRATTYSIQYLFEADNGAYVADDSIGNAVTESRIGELTSLAGIPESFPEKPGYVADTDKNAAETAQIVYANGKRTVQAYYRRAAVTGLVASMKEGAEVPPYTDTAALRQYITVKETYEDGSGAEITDYTLAESVEEGGSSALIAGRTGGAYAGKTYMPFSGTVTFAVTAGDRSTTVDIPVTSGSTAGVQDFDSADTLSVDYVSGGLASRSTAVKLGETGGAAALKADNGQQYSQGNIYSTIDVSDVDTLYYWLYFDSTTFVSTREGYDQDNLPEIVDRVIAHTGLENWSRESLSHVPLAWDTWIPMRATKNAGNTETNVLRVRFHNMEYTWGFTDSWNTNSGFTYTVYLDGISTEEPDLPEVTGIAASMKEGVEVAPYTDTDTLRQYITVERVYDDGARVEITDYTLAESVAEGGSSALIAGSSGGAYAGKTYMPFSGTVPFAVTAGEHSTTVGIPVTSGSTAGVQDFDSADTLSVDYGYGGLASRSTAVRLGDTGGAAALRAGASNVYSEGNIYSTIDVSGVDTLYYWLYFDSTTFVSTREGYDQDNLPEILPAILEVTGLANWTVISLSQVPPAWDTWIPICATKNEGNTETNVLRIRFHATENRWGLSSGYGASGFAYTVYLDGISTEEPDLPEVSYAQGDTQIFRTDTVDKIDKNDITVSIPQADGTALTPAAEELTLSADFLRSNVVTVYYGGAAIGTFEVTFAGTMLLDFDDGVNVTGGYGGSLGAQTKNRLGDSGYGAGVNFNGSLDVSRNMTDLDLTGIDTIYYYVYLDDTVWTCSNISASEVTLASVIARVRPAGWTTTALTEVGWNRWILIKADRGTADTTTPVTWTFGAYSGSWGVSANLSGFSGNVICFDEIFWLPDA